MDVRLLAEFVTGATWSVGGLIVGYSLGKTERNLSLLHRRVEQVLGQPPQGRGETAMTTPQRLRRRQYTLGIFVLLLSVFSVAEGIYFQIQDKHQRECLQVSFADLSTTLDARGDLVQRQADSTERLITNVFNAKTPQQARAAFKAYTSEQQAIERGRKRNPIPPFPAGKCS